MEPPTRHTWRRYPGYQEEDSGEDSEEDEVTRNAARRLPDLIKALGQEWVDTPCVKFEAPEKKGGPGSQPLWCSIPSQWGAAGPLPKFRIERIRAPAVRATLESNGMRPAVAQDWVLSWSGPGMKEAAYQALHEFQRVNHFPGSSAMTQKDKLWLSFAKMARQFGAAFDFVPETFVMPEQAQEFKEAYEKNNHVWIVKPNASSQGKGIFLLRDLKDLPLKDIAVVSRYVDNPLLIQGLKFDLRIYVLVTSYEPLRAYVYREGLTRFASLPYSTDGKHLNDAYRHLTNYSINKFAQNFRENQEVQADNVGHKWSLSALNKHLEHTGLDSDLMWARIHDLIVKTLLSVEPVIAAKTRKNTTGSNCFELYGFDVLVDDTLKPWLLEVNLSPCMNADSPLDWTVKSSLLSDTFNLVGIRRPDFQTVASARMRHRLAQMKQLSEKQREREQRQKHVRDEGNQQGTGCESSNDAAKDRQEAQGSAGSSTASPDQPWNPLEEPVVIEEVGRSATKSLAHALQEVSRRRNFIRLYPTRATVKRYAPIVSSRAVPKAAYGESSGSTSSAEPPPVRHASELLASLFFGPAPLLTAPPRPAPVLTEAPQESRAEAEAVVPVPQPQAVQRDDSPPKEEPQDDDDVLQFVQANDEDFRFQDARLATAAAQAVAVLGSKVGSRLAFMEYLIRICNACAGLGAATKAKLVESRAHRIAAFRRQLSVFLRTNRIPGSAEDVLLEGRSSCLLDRLATLSQATLLRLLRDAWGLLHFDIAAAIGKGTTLEKISPAAFVSTGSGSRAVSLLMRLSVADLEGFLQSSQCALEFRSLMEAPDADTVEAALVRDVLKQDGERPSSAVLRQRVQDLFDTPLGPLAELRHLTRVTPHPVPRPLPEQALDSPRICPASGISPSGGAVAAANAAAAAIEEARALLGPPPVAKVYEDGPRVRMPLLPALTETPPPLNCGPKMPNLADGPSPLKSSPTLPALVEPAPSVKRSSATATVPTGYPRAGGATELPAIEPLSRRLAKGGNAASMPALSGLLAQNATGAQDGAGSSLWRRGGRYEASRPALSGGIRWKSSKPSPAAGGAGIVRAAFDDIEL